MSAALMQHQYLQCTGINLYLLSQSTHSIKQDFNYTNKNTLTTVLYWQPLSTEKSSVCVCVKKDQRGSYRRVEMEVSGVQEDASVSSWFEGVNTY